MSVGTLPPPSALTSVAATRDVDIPTWSSTGVPVIPPAQSSGQPLPPPSLLLPHGMILSPAADPIPYQLVQRIRAGEFVEMRDLLADNISLYNQLEDLHGQAPIASTPASFRPRLREIPSLNSWMYCFTAYMAVCTGDSRTREMLAYCRLIIREALRHGGNGWQEYDRTFRRQAAIDTNIPWNTLQPGLQAATLLGFPNNRGTFCSLCREPDHHSSQCALTVMQQPVRTAPSADFRRGPDLPTRHPFCPPRRPETILSICASWNRGTCAFPGSAHSGIFVGCANRVTEGLNVPMLR